MVREYMVTKFGAAKNTGEIYSRGSRVKTAKDGSYGYLDEKDTCFFDEIKPLGTIVKVELMEQ